MKNLNAIARIIILLGSTFYMVKFVFLGEANDGLYTIILLVIYLINRD